MPRAFKKIKDYNETDLNDAVKTGVDYCIEKDLDFWKIMNAVDAYFERRRRKEELEAALKAEKIDHDYFGHKD